MKKLFTLLALAIILIASAQAPQGFNYQATVRNSAGQLLLNQDVLVKFNILQNSAIGDIVYSETQTAKTDDLGHIALVVGQGTAPTGTFSMINWGSGSYYLGIELDSGTGYVAMGTTQLLSVPYALYANSSGNSQSATPSLTAVLAVNNGANNLQIKNLSDPTDAKDAVNKSYLAVQIANLQSQIIALQNANTYPLPNVSIGTQIWQSTNLDVTTYRDGTSIPQVTNPAAWNNLTTGAWCYYKYDSSNGPIYGKLYNWYAVVGIYDATSLNDSSLRKQFAPQGWHVPSDEEWTILTDYLGGNSVAGGKMKEIGTTLWVDPNRGATNSSSFKGLPGGFNYPDGIFSDQGFNGYWWSTTEANTTDAYDLFANYYSEAAFRGYQSKAFGLSVRCIKN